MKEIIEWWISFIRMWRQRIIHLLILYKNMLVEINYIL